MSCSRAAVLLSVYFTIYSSTVASAASPYHPDVRSDRPSPLISPEEKDADFWIENAESTIKARYNAGYSSGRGKARNLVMFLGDGMSIPTLTAARTLLGQRRNQTGEEAQLSFETFPTVGLSKTYCVNAQVADSACTATAYLTGVKANGGTIGVTAAVPRWDCQASRPLSTRTESIAAWALADGRDAGIVTTTRVTHASPAGAYASVANRHWENDAEVRADGHDPNDCPDIAYQLIHSDPGKQFKVILGGGRREFIPLTSVDEEGIAGRRTDGRNLIQEWQREKSIRNVSHQYIWNLNQLLDVNKFLPDYLLGLFEGNHLQYHMEGNPETEPTLENLTETAIRMLSRNEKGFFLFVEGGRIDHAHHENLVELALDETIEMSKAVARAAELLSEEDSLIVVTADHTHVMTFNGYTQRGGDVLGPSADRDTDNIPYMTLSYANGPGRRREVSGRRVDITQDHNYRQLDWRTHVDVPLESETHGGDDVAVFARGPHHEMFSGLYEQNHIPHRMAYAACIGSGLQACNSAVSHQPLTFLIIILLCLLPFIVNSSCPYTI